MKSDVGSKRTGRRGSCEMGRWKRRRGRGKAGAESLVTSMSCLGPWELGSSGGVGKSQGSDSVGAGCWGLCALGPNLGRKLLTIPKAQP